MKRILIFTCCCLFSLSLLAGCGDAAVAEKEGSDIQDGLDPEEIRVSEETLAPAQWKDGFREAAFDTADETPYYEIRRSQYQSPEIGISVSWQKEIFGFSWNARYILDNVETSEGRRYFLTRQKSDLKMGKPKEILTDWQDRQEGYGICMDVGIEDRVSILFVQKSGRGKGELTYQLLQLSAKGNFQAAQDVTEAYRELGFSEDQLSEPGVWWCDGEGYQYLICPGRTALAVIDPQGKLLFRKECDAEFESFAAGFHMPDGSMAFSKGNTSGEGSKLFQLDIPSGTEQILYQFQGMLLKQFTITPQGQLYYSEGDRLYLWDLRSGRKTCLFAYAGSGISPNDAYTDKSCWLTVNGEGEFYIYDTGSGSVTAFADEMPNTGEEITCVMMGDYLNYIQPCAAAFSREYDGKQIKIEKLGGYIDESWMLLSARVAAGNLPDIIVVSTREQMRVLQEKGVLASLEDLLSDETKDSLFTGARMMGTIDGELYGIAPVAMVFVPSISTNLWEKKDWTLENVLDIAESQDLKGLYYGGGGPWGDLHFLLGDSVGKNPFYEEESGTSHFDSEDFCRLLKVCRKYGDMGGASEEQAREWLAQGKILAIKEWIRNIGDYARLRENYGEASHFAGYLGQGDNIGIYTSENYVLVSKNAEDKQEIAAFLEYLLSDEALQNTDFMPLTRSAAEKSISTYDNDGTTYVMYKGGYELPLGEDGNSYMEEYLEFMDHVGGWMEESPVWEIINEETEAFWNDEKSAEEVAGIIDNRVQLYLDESHIN